MYPPLSFTPLKAMLLASLDNITFAEIGVFMLFFLVFVFCFFLSLIFWRFRRILFLFFLVETGILLSIPYGISAVSKKIIYPIEVRYEKFRPFVYTTGFNYDIEITSKAKLPLKKCFLTIIPKREGANILPKPKNLALLDSSDSTQADSSTQAESSQVDSAQVNSSDKKPNPDEQSNQTSQAQSSQAQNQAQEFANESKESIEAKSLQESQENLATESQAESNTEQKTEQSTESTTTKPAEQNTQKPPKQPKPPSQYALKAYKILDYIIPLDAFVEVLELESPLKYNKKVRWQGIIRDYKYDEHFGAQISCH